MTDRRLREQLRAESWTAFPYTWLAWQPPQLSCAYPATLSNCVHCRERVTSCSPRPTSSEMSMLRRSCLRVNMTLDHAATSHAADPAAQRTTSREQSKEQNCPVLTLAMFNNLRMHAQEIESLTFVIDSQTAKPSDRTSTASQQINHQDHQ